MLILLIILSMHQAYGQVRENTAFVNIKVIPMNEEVVLENQTVLIIKDRFTQNDIYELLKEYTATFEK